MRTSLIFSLGLSALLFLPGVIADAAEESHCMAGDILGEGIWTGSWLSLFIIFSAFGGLLLFAFLFFTLQSQQSQHGKAPPIRDGLRIAEDRLAKGEITPEEFDEIRKRIQ